VSITLDEDKNRTGHIWHVFIEKLELPILYAYRLSGNRCHPHYYDPKHLVVDPYAKVLKSHRVWGEGRQGYKAYGVIQKETPFDWRGTSFPRISLKDLVIYEMHVRGFTQDSSSKVRHPGSFLGLVEKIPYLVNLGVNAVELMPIHEFNEGANPRKNPETKELLYNYWGYSTLHFFSPMLRYAVGKELDAAIVEFKTLVRELHSHGIEVILDVVFNHTGEKRCAPVSFSGIDRSSYYLLHEGHDTNYTGCGNTLNCNHPIMQQFILDCLRYWVTEMRVDGFRFDLASVFNRDMQGNLVPMSSMVTALSLDPVLAKTKLIAEPWDVAGAYQLGAFYPHENRWSEWNGKYRDCIRHFIKGDENTKNEFSERLCGSQILFPLRSPQASVNFITAHDGFSLKDLVSYNKKHNYMNGEGSRDGNNANISWNHGVEGPTEDTVGLRSRQMKNFLLALMVSRGIPMIFMGDEYGHEKLGNNNTWCQDGKLNWFLWEKLQKNQSFYRFVRRLIHFRQEHEILKADHFAKNTEIIWHGIEPSHIHWEDGKALIALTILDTHYHEDIYVAFNATAEGVTFTLPDPHEGKKWHVVFDTFAASPHDAYETGEEKAIEDKQYYLQAYSGFLVKAF